MPAMVLSPQALVHVELGDRRRTYLIETVNPHVMQLLGVTVCLPCSLTWAAQGNLGHRAVLGQTVTHKGRPLGAGGRCGWLGIGPAMPTCGLPEKNKGLAEAKPKFLLVGHVGIEPTTNGLRVEYRKFKRPWRGGGGRASAGCVAAS